MAAGQPLRGFVAQGMDGRKKSFQGEVFQYAPGSYTFMATQTGYWKFVLWGGGDAAGNQTSGAYCEYTRLLSVQQTVALLVGGGAFNSTATFSDGKVVTAGGAGASPGVATGGDVNLDGSAAGVDGQGTGGGAAHSGAGAPANLPFHGGAGNSGGLVGHAPGGGSGSAALQGSDGTIIAYFVRP